MANQHTTVGAARANTTLIPQAAGVGDTRVGVPGNTNKLSDAGHVHPIARLAQVALPNLAVSGGTFNSQNVYRQSSTEETQTFQVQLLFTPTSVGAWKTINFPTIAGYVLEQVNFNGVYALTNTAAAYTGQTFMYLTTFYIANATLAQHYVDFSLVYRLL